MKLAEFHDKYEFELEKMAEELLGSCTMGTPEVTEWGFKEADADMVWEALDEYIYDCPNCGWWCDVSDRYATDDCGEEVCGECCENWEDE